MGDVGKKNKRERDLFLFTSVSSQYCNYTHISSTKSPQPLKNVIFSN